MTQPDSTASLFERLGGAEGIRAISSDVVDRHCINPLIRQRFHASEPDTLKKLVADFFIAGSGGPDNYEGRDMRTAHQGMNLNERELVAAIDDVLAAIDARGVDPSTRNEVLAILYSFKDEILFQ